MPISCHYDRERNILLGKMSGLLTEDDYRANMEEIIQSAEIPSDANTIWDMRKVDVSGLTFEFMTGLISFREDYPERGSSKIALLVPDDFSYALGRMYEGHSRHLPQTTKIFQDYSQALAWLLN